MVANTLVKGLCHVIKLTLPLGNQIGCIATYMMEMSSRKAINNFFEEIVIGNLTPV